MSIRTARTKKAIIALLTIIGLSAFVLIYVPALHHPIYFIEAEMLSQQPETYFYLENPDDIVSQAISNPDGFVTIDSLEDTQIDELINEHDTGNVLVNDSYYEIGIVVGDNFPSLFESYLFLISFVTLPASVLALVVLVLFKATGRFQRNSKSAQA